MNTLAFDELWGSTIRSVLWSIPLHRLILTLEILEDGLQAWRNLEFTDVMELIFKNGADALLDWDYAEFTSIDVQEFGSFNGVHCDV